MKKLLLILYAIVISVSAFAQSPQKMSYQAVIRDSSNGLISNAPVGLQ